jgi:hypothetical protein
MNISNKLEQLLKIKLFNKSNLNHNFFSILQSFDFKFNKNKLVIQELDNKQDLVYLIKDNSFLNKKKYLELAKQDLLISQYTYENITITVYNLNNKDLDIKFIIECVKIIEHVAENIFNKNINIQVNINLFLTDEKKKFGKTKILEGDNINSGVTLLDSYIFIWRYEEVYKVLLHELIHYYNIAMKDKDIKEDINICFKGRNSINEAITESLAIIIYSYLIAKNKNLNLARKINSELVFNFFQVNKILTFFDLKSIKNLFTDTCNRYIVQNTSVVSYFIIKVILLNNFEEYFDFILNSPELDYNKFVKVLNSSLEKSDLLINLDKIKIFDYTTKDLTSNNILFNTLRMSVYSILK